MGEFRMPSLGADMEEGTLLEWRVAPGDAVHRGDIVAVVDTAKAAVEVEAFEDGVVQRLLVQPGTAVPVGTPLALLGDAVPDGHPAVASPVVRHLAHLRGVDLGTVRGSGPGGVIERADVERAAPAPPRPAPPVATPAPPVAPPPEGARPPVSPYARRRAAELGVDLAGLTGSGPDGAVTAADVEAAAKPAAPAPAPAPAPKTPDRSEAMRRAIGSAMARSKREIPHYYLSTTIDLGRATAWLAEANAGRPATERLVPAALLLKATALALRKVPELNGFWTDDAFRPADSVHLGVAIALRPSGLVAPAIHDADRLPLGDLMAALTDLVRRARAGSLRQSEVNDATVTVTNLGDQGVDSVLGVIYPPQVALVGFGRVREQPWAERGLLGVRPVVTATLAADHRVSDGHRGGRFLDAVADLLSRPEEL